MRVAALLLCLMAGLPAPQFGQTEMESRLAAEIRAAAASVAGQPRLAQWKASHKGERVDLAHYESYKDPYQLDREERWCATSVAVLPDRVRRAASFYVPSGGNGELPDTIDPTRVNQCGLGGVWIEAMGVDAVGGVAQALQREWGQAREVRTLGMTQELPLRGAGLWSHVVTWRRSGARVFAALADGSRTVVWITNAGKPDFRPEFEPFDTATAALELAGGDAAMAADLKPPTNCSKMGVGNALRRLSRRLDAAKEQPPAQRAAALLAIDSFVGCAMASGASAASLRSRGVRLAGGCPQDGPGYSNNLRDEAIALDPEGPAGALATLAAMQSPCSLKGSKPWPDRVLETGSAALTRFPEGVWTPWMHFALGRAHATKLAFSIPPGEADMGAVHRLSRAEAQREREAAIAEFRAFLAARPNEAAAAFAWREAWRLLAGLPPTQVNFGCGCE